MLNCVPYQIRWFRVVDRERQSQVVMDQAQTRAATACEEAMAGQRRHTIAGESLTRLAWLVRGWKFVVNGSAGRDAGSSPCSLRTFYHLQWPESGYPCSFPILRPGRWVEGPATLGAIHQV
jgi:hypothetical protein